MKCVVFAAIAYASSGADSRSMRGAATDPKIDALNLPKVDSVMMPTRDTLQHVVSDFRKIEDFVAAQKEVVRAKLSTEKKRYEAAIAVQAQTNQRLFERIQQLQANISTSKQLQEMLRKQNDNFVASTNAMRSCMSEISPKLGVAEEFLATVEDDVPGLETDEADALRPPPPEKTLDYYLNKTRREMGLDGSLLQVSDEPKPKVAKAIGLRSLLMKNLSPKLAAAKELFDLGLEGDKAFAVRPPAPETSLEYYVAKTRKEMGLDGSLLQISGQASPKDTQKVVVKLVDTLERIAAAEKQSMDMLRDKFAVVNQSQAARHARLMNQTEYVYKQWSAHNATVRDLLVARRHLNRTNVELKMRLHGFMQLQQNIIRMMNETLKVSADSSSDVKP